MVTRACSLTIAHLPNSYLKLPPFFLLLERLCKQVIANKGKFQTIKGRKGKKYLAHK